MEEKRNNEATFAEKIGSFLKHSQQEIEELALQFSLGKAEAADKFEEIKKEFHSKSFQWKQSFEKFKTTNKDIFQKVKGGFEELQLQLSLGKAEGKDLFEDQKKKILLSIHELEMQVKNDPELSKQWDEFNVEIEKFKLKLEILSLKYKLKKFELKDSFKSSMTEAKKEIEHFYSRTEKKISKEGHKYIRDFTGEINEVYLHLKKAIKSL